MNVFKGIFGEAKKVVEAPVSDVVKVSRIFGELTTDAPELRAALIGMVGELETVGADVAAETAADGLNFPAYAKLATDSVTAIQYYNAQVKPIIAQVFAQLAPAPEASPVVAMVPATSPVLAASAVALKEPTSASGPGLHNVTPD